MRMAQAKTRGVDLEGLRGMKVRVSGFTGEETSAWVVFQRNGWEIAEVTSSPKYLMNLVPALPVVFIGGAKSGVFTVEVKTLGFQLTAIGPNPVMRDGSTSQVPSLFISTDEDQPGARLEIRIYNLLGHLLYEDSFLKDITRGTHEIQLQPGTGHRWASGVYLVHLNYNGIETRTGKFTILR